MQQLTEAFDFTLAGEERLGNHRVYVLDAKPRVPATSLRILRLKYSTGMQGKLWIDKKTYQWVKVEAEVIYPISIAGFLVKVEPGTRFELEQMPVGNGAWLPKHFAMKARAKVLAMFKHHEATDETYWKLPKDGIGNFLIRRQIGKPDGPIYE